MILGGEIHFIVLKSYSVTLIILFTFLAGCGRPDKSQTLSVSVNKLSKIGPDNSKTAADKPPQESNSTAANEFSKNGFEFLPEPINSAGTSLNLLDPNNSIFSKYDSPAPRIRMFSKSEIIANVLNLTDKTLDISKARLENIENSLTPLAKSLRIQDSMALRSLAESLVKSVSEMNTDKIFKCKSGDKQCVKLSIESFLMRAFRGPVAEKDVLRAVQLFENIAAKKGDALAFKVVAQEALLSPRFLYLIEQKEDESSTQLNSWQIASRMSYFIAGIPPDDELLDLAKKGALSDASVRQKQTLRLLQSPAAVLRASLMIQAWLGLERPALERKGIDAEESLLLESDMRKEFTSIVKKVLFTDKAHFQDIFTSDYSEMNARIAKIYNMPGVSGDAFQPVKLSAVEYRSGILTTPLVLSSYSKDKGRSPIQRGFMIASPLLCQQMPQKAGAISALLPAHLRELKSKREQFAGLETMLPCAHCHKILNSGFAFDRFDPIGRAYSVTEIPNSELVTSYRAAKETGFKFSGPIDAARKLAGTEQSRKCFTSRIFEFLESRTPGPGDEIYFEELWQNFKSSEFVYTDFIQKIVSAESFIKFKK